MGTDTCRERNIIIIIIIIIIIVIVNFCYLAALRARLFGVASTMNIIATILLN